MEWSTTNQPRFDALVQTFGSCESTGFDVRTERYTTNMVSSNAVDNIGFNIIIP